MPSKLSTWMQERAAETFVNEHNQERMNNGSKCKMRCEIIKNIGLKVIVFDSVE